MKWRVPNSFLSIIIMLLVHQYHSRVVHRLELPNHTKWQLINIPKRFIAMYYKNGAAKYISNRRHHSDTIILKGLIIETYFLVRVP